MGTGEACSPGRNSNPVVFDRQAAVTAIAKVLDAYHHNASIAAEAPYFALLAPGATLLGTDGTERWTVEEFRAYAHPYFAKGQGWTYTVRAGGRHIEVSENGTAWFDEALHNDGYGDCRGTGVLRLIGGEWKIAQYNLSIPIPNDLSTTIVASIRAKH
jgi:hypothetical protein